MKQKIVITPVGPTLIKNDIKNFLKNNFEYKFTGGIVHDQLLNRAQLNGASAAIVGSEYFDEETLLTLEKMKIMVRFGGGLPNLDFNLAKKKGIKLYDIKTKRVSNEVSLLVIAKILNFAFNLHHYYSSVKKNIWKRRTNSSVEHLTVGLIGAGKIAHNLVPKLKSLGFSVGYWSRNRKKSLESLGAKFTNQLEKLILHYKIICIVVSKNNNTQLLINKNNLSLMKENIVINVSRGGIVDEEAMISAIDSGNVTSYLTDVTEYEPPEHISAKLIKHQNVLSTPHIGGYSKLNLLENTKKALEVIHNNLNK